jgi:hypothetical protein
MLLMMLSVFLGCTKYTQPIELTMIFNVNKLIGKQMTQCFASIRMSNYSWAQ